MQEVWGSIARIGRYGGMLLVVAAVFAGGLGLGTGLASTGAQTGGEIRGCVNMYTGAVRIPNGTGQCASNERPLSWNQQGPSGLLDIQVVEERITVKTEDETDNATVIAECPSGYQVIGGGAGFGGGSAKVVNIWAMDISSPFEGGQFNRENDGWRGSFTTFTGEDADGRFLFFAKATCALTT